MKKILFILFTLFLFTGKITLSQTTQVWGVTDSGGVYNTGTIFKMNLDGSGFTVVHDFNTATGRYPCGSLVKATDNKLYGMTIQGGANSSGVIYCIDPATNVYSKVYDFAAGSQVAMTNKLLLANDGKLYGTTVTGGVNNDGILFRFSPGTGIFTKLIDFQSASSGRYAQGCLMQASNGLLYGTTVYGALYGDGALFSFNIISNTFNRLYSFDDSGTGPAPYCGALIQDGTGLLYGTSGRGGNYAKGTLFTYNIASTTLTKNASFTGLNITPKGSFPYGSLLRTSAGNFYGMTYMGGNNGDGSLFLYSSAGGGTTTDKAHFSSLNKGAHPRGALISASNGKLFGITENGGLYNRGTVFYFDIATNAITKIHEFAGADGNFPTGELYEVTCTAAPATPGAIYVGGGSAAVCPLDMRTYSVPAIAGITYTWTGFTGASITSNQTNSHVIVVNFTSSFTASSGVIQVTANNDCGTSAPRSITVQRSTPPATPGSITGSSAVCSFSFQTYSIAAVSGATSYNWMVPAGSFIRNNNGTSINAVMGAPGGSITVTASNGCGTSGIRTKNITVNCREGELTEQKTESIMEVFPNPTNGMATLKFSAKENEACELTITDLTGRIIKQEQINGEEGINRHAIDLASVVKGIYLVKIKTSANEIIKRLVKN